MPHQFFYVRLGVSVGVFFRGVLMMLGRMQRMAMRDLGVMRGLLVMTALGVIGRFAMMLGCMFVMLGGLFVMFVDFVAVHNASPCEMV